MKKLITFIWGHKIVSLIILAAIISLVIKKLTPKKALLLIQPQQLKKVC